MKDTFNYLRGLFAKPVFYAVRHPAHLLRILGHWLAYSVGPAIEGFGQRRIDNALDRYDRMRLKAHYLPERYAIDEKPPGWNDAVLGYFHRAPDHRSKSSAFSAAFHERARKPVHRGTPVWPWPERACGERRHVRSMSGPRI